MTRMGFGIIMKRSRDSGGKEKKMSQIPKPFEIYRHFKGNLYQVLNIAEHTETGEMLVIYQALYGSYQIYARPLAQFTEKLDKTRYPGASQEYRVVLQKNDNVGETVKKAENIPQMQIEEETEELHIDPMVLRFLDADTYEEKLKLLTGMQHRITEEMLVTMAIACDIEIPEGTLDEKFQSLKTCLMTLDKFECNRLR